MVRKLLCFVLILVTVSASFTKLWIYAGFEMNRDYIAKELCVNRKKPVATCYGQCFLNKQLKKADREEKKQSSTASSKHFVTEVFFEQAPAFKSFLHQTDEFELPAQNLYSFRRLTGIFHPPSLA